jgi:hypothetical protein
MKVMNEKLREQLDGIVSQQNERNWYDPELFKAVILPLLPKELEIIEYPPQHIYNYNYFLFILGLYTNSQVLKETGGFIYSSFIEKLIENNELELSNNPVEGDIVLYSNVEIKEVVYTHAGFLEESDKVISKWSWGQLLKHGIYDVPNIYGDKFSYYRSISKERALKLYQRYK